MIETFPGRNGIFSTFFVDTFYVESLVTLRTENYICSVKNYRWPSLVDRRPNEMQSPERITSTSGYPRWVPNRYYIESAHNTSEVPLTVGKCKWGLRGVLGGQGDGQVEFSPCLGTFFPTFPEKIELSGRTFPPAQGNFSCLPTVFWAVFPTLPLKFSSHFPTCPTLFVVLPTMFWAGFPTVPSIVAATLPPTFRLLFLQFSYRLSCFFLHLLNTFLRTRK